MLLLEGDPLGHSRALRLRCRLLVQLQDFAQAIEAAGQAAAVAKQQGHGPAEAMALQLKADCQMRNQALVEGRDTALQARAERKDGFKRALERRGKCIESSWTAIRRP